MAAAASALRESDQRLTWCAPSLSTVCHCQKPYTAMTA
jgi:hypothetical protein